MNRRTLGFGTLFLSCLLLATLGVPITAAPQELRPNLQPFPAFDLHFSTNVGTGTSQIRFSTRSWNRGSGPLELRAGEVVSSGQNVYQRVYNGDGTYSEYFAGTFVYHPAHSHFHFNDYALYQLDPLNAPGGSSKNGSKTTFCIMDTNKIDGSLPGAPPNAVYTTCEATIQGMSVGWADTYGYPLEGQSIDVTGNPSGDYCLTIQIDPKGRLVESDETDNQASALVRIDMERQTVAMIDSTGCHPTGAGVVVTGVNPPSGATGTTFSMTVTGSGFTAGMPVNFENGTGPAPTARDVIVEPGGTTLHATVTLKKGKPGKDPVWDVRVGTGSLPSAFTVTP